MLSSPADGGHGGMTTIEDSIPICGVIRGEWEDIDSIQWNLSIDKEFGKYE